MELKHAPIAQEAATEDGNVIPLPGLEQPQISQIPYSFAKRHGLLVDGWEGRRVKVLATSRASVFAMSEIARHIAHPLQFYAVSEEVFQTTLQQSYDQGSNEAAMQAMGDIGDDLDLSQVAQQLGEPEDLMEAQDDAPIIRLINAMLTEAIKSNASDIHIEPFENRMVVRFRVDGMLREVLEPNRALGPLLVSRIKVMAKLDIAEKRLPQDGRISLKVAGRSVDVRVSTLPSGHGERVVLRILDKKAGRLDLTQLGMQETQQEQIDEIIHKPHGIVLVTGPTGSGKTTTLYAVLTRLNDRKRSLMTVEDPIEYFLDGVGQTQVNTKVELTFARGLRAILRQDPDVVMVGEIRDLETAEIAVQASLTGHLVLSTLHTNSAVGAVTRLHDMGVEPFLLSTSLIGVVAQRLVRTLCPHCRKPYHPGQKECEWLGISYPTNAQIYTPVGCEQCNQSGFRGRAGIFELVKVDDQLRTMIHDGVGEHVIEKHARKFTPSIRQDGMRNVLLGVTTLEEVLRVTRED